MKLSTAFSTAWKDLKATAAKVATTVTRNSAAIQTVVTDGSAVAIAVDPSAAGAVTAFDTLEEVIIGKIAAAASDVASANSLSAVFEEAWPAIKSLISTLENHPTVASVTAALEGSKVPAAATKN